jgi:tight adherence protein C
MTAVVRLVVLVAVFAAAWTPTVPGRVAALAGRPPPAPGFGDDRRTAVLAAVSAGSVVFGLVPVAAPIVVAAMLRRRHGAHVAVRRRRHAVDASLAGAVDLFRLAVGAGLTVSEALAAVAPRTDGPVGDALGEAAAQVAAGRPVDGELDALVPVLGEAARPLVGALVTSVRYGAPLGPALERVADDLRDDLRRRAEARARRVPVLLLFPLLSCIVPAFVALTVVPLVASGLGSLGVPSG